MSAANTATHHVDKTKVMASNSTGCRILIQNELEQVDTFPYLGSLITEDGECMTEFRTKLKRGDRGITAENMEVTAYQFQWRYD